MKVALVGAGFMAQVAHIPSLGLVNGVEITAIADLDEQTANSVAARHGIPRVYRTSSELLAGEAELDAVIVATPRMHHAESAIPLIERGIPVLLEKPLEATVAAGADIVAAQARGGGIVVVGYHNRYDPAFLEAERHLWEGALGSVRYARIHSFGGAWKAGALLPGEIDLSVAPTASGPPVAQSRDGRTFPPEVEWVEGWIHEVNMVRGLLGEPTEVSFSTNGMPRLALVQFEQAQGLFEVGLVHPAGTPFDCTIDIQCEKGSIALAFAPPLVFRQPSTITITTPAGVSRPSLAYTESFVAEVVHFLRCARGEEQPRTGLAEAMRDLELCFAIIAAGANKRAA